MNTNNHRRLFGGAIFAVAALLFLALASITPAWAGDKLIGTILVTDGGTASNRTTGYTAYACPSNVNGGCFEVGVNNIIDVQCVEDCFVCLDMSGCDAGTGVALGAGMLLPESTASIAITNTGKAYNSDGGSAGHSVTYTGGWISVSPWNTDAGGTTVHAKVFQRNGRE